MARILRAPLARADLLDIWTHIATESSPAVTDTFLARIYGALDVLASAPAPFFRARNRNDRTKFHE